MAAALRDTDDGPLIVCEREESFSALFEYLGKHEEQSAIRAREPDKRHCSILRDHPSACAGLPMDFESDEFGSFAAGSICPNNPYFKFADKIARAESSAPLVERAADLYRAANVGALRPDSPTIEITLAHAYSEWVEAKRNEAWQAKSSNSLLK